MLYLGVVDDFGLGRLLAKLEHSIGIRLPDEVALYQLGRLDKVHTQYPLHGLGLLDQRCRLG